MKHSDAEEGRTACAAQAREWKRRGRDIESSGEKRYLIHPQIGAGGSYPALIGRETKGLPTAPLCLWIASGRFKIFKAVYRNKCAAFCNGLHQLDVSCSDWPLGNLVAIACRADDFVCTLRLFENKPKFVSDRTKRSKLRIVIAQPFIANRATHCCHEVQHVFVVSDMGHEDRHAASELLGIDEDSNKGAADSSSKGFHGLALLFSGRRHLPRSLPIDAETRSSDANQSCCDLKPAGRVLWSNEAERVCGRQHAENGTSQEAPHRDKGNIVSIHTNAPPLSVLSSNNSAREASGAMRRAA